MLQPRTYPTLLGKALVLEPDAFATMADDDAPALEGAFFAAMLGLLVGAAQVVGGLLYSWAMPPAASLTAILNRFAAGLEATGLPGPARLLETGWLARRALTGYDTGWGRLLALVWEPFLLLALWLLAGLLLYAIGRALGGSGTLQSVLGAAALALSPAVLLLLTVLPFVRVNSLLLVVWGLLLLYRAAEIAHVLPWQRAAAAAVTTVLLLAVLVVLLGLAGGTLLVAL
jgi:hypothetical protein